MNIYQPTYLYIKRHLVTGLCYLGKTIRDPNLYSGSGVYWRRHLAKHGFDIETTYTELFDTKEELTETALFLSELYDIVNSPNWANLMIENGMTGGSLSDESLLEISKKLKGKKKSQYTISEKALEQRENARSKKRDAYETKLILHGENRTEAQKHGRLKANATKKRNGRSLNEIKQFNEFAKKGTIAAALANTGCKILYNIETGIRKFAKPNSDKWKKLIEDGFIPKSINL
jgi:hypothetical protein